MDLYPGLLRNWRCAAVLGVLLCAAALSFAQNTSNPLLRPAAIAYDAAGDLFIADSNRNQVFEIKIAGALSAVAGNGTQGFGGDGGPATAAMLNEPSELAVGADGTLYIADTGNQRIRAVSNGQITSFAGTGAPGFSGDGGLATSAQLDRPIGLAMDSTGALLVCDSGNQRIRRVSNGVITTIAGDGIQGFAGDGGSASTAELNAPSGIAVAADGRIFLADTGNHRVRVINATGAITTVAGAGVGGYSGDGGPATVAQLDRPFGLALTSGGALLIADQDDQRLRSVSATGIITTLAGSGTQGTSPDGANGVSASLNSPAAVAAGPFWSAFADEANGTVRLLLPDGTIYQPAGIVARSMSVNLTASDTTYGSATASVTVAGDPASPLGTVSLSEDGTPLGSASISSGMASLPLPSLSTGTHTITAQYSGDGLHPAASATSSINIASTQIVATANAVTMQFGAAVPALNGSFTGALPQDASQLQVVFSTTATSASPAGVYPITATLTGAASAGYTLALSAASGSLTITPAVTTATVAPAQNAYAGMPMLLNAQVVSATGGIPAGTVQFLDGGSVVATSSLQNGSASAVDLTPVAGAHTFTAKYEGGQNFQSSVSSPQSVTVQALPDYTIATSSTAQQTVLGGDTASYSFAVASQSSPFTGAVTFSVSGLPAGATASFSPPAVVPGASSASVVMTVQTVPLASRLNLFSSRNRATLLALLVLPTIFLRRRRLAGIAVCSVFLLAAVIGCGARTAPESALPSQSYILTVKGTATNLAGAVVVHSATVTLSVE